MISKNLSNVCREDISMIENYNIAINDNNNLWICHHRLGIAIKSGKLKELGLYYNRPAIEFVFLRTDVHTSLHQKINHYDCSGENNSMYGKNSEDYMTPEAIKAKREKLSKALKGKKKPEGFAIGDKNSRAKAVLQIDKNTGEVIKRFGCIKYAAESVGLCMASIQKCLYGKWKQAGGYIWKFAV